MRIERIYYGKTPVILFIYFAVLRIDPEVSHMLGKCSTMEL
jgi:hypothetical protein